MENKTVFVMGAGISANLKIPTSEQISDLIHAIDKTNDNLTKLKKILDGTFGEKKYDINDIFNLIDSNLLLHNALQCKEIKIEYYDLEKCKRDLITYIFKEFLKKIKTKDTAQYEELVGFYAKLAEKEIYKKFNCDLDFQDREFFISSYSIINFNWDLYSLLPVIEANSRVNHAINLCFAKGRNPNLRIYTDFNCEYASKGEDNRYWYPFTETAAFSVNNPKFDATRRVFLLKCFYPHGAMNLFKCTSCAKHSYYLGELNLDSVVKKLNYDDNKPLYKCPYCEKEVFSSDFDVLMQSNFKTRNSFLEEIRLSMTQELRTAKTLVFIGYSMPSDDVDYITMIKSLYCSVENVFVVLYEDGGENNFVGYSELSDKAKSKAKNFDKVFKQKAKYNMAGFPTAKSEILNRISL